MSTSVALSKRHLVRALAQEQIWSAYQPLIDLNTGTLSGFEVLARWSDPVRGEVTPAEFIPLAERTGQIDKLTRYILQHACGHALSWPGDFFLAFNISPLQFSNAGLDRLIIDELVRSNFPIRRICIEITEGAIIEDDEIAAHTVQNLKDSGITLALDDFGSGYGSLCRLHAFPFDKLKIDRKFVGSLETNPLSRKIVSSVVGLGLSLGLDVVAEGVETEKQVAILRKLGCTTAQGWAFGRPLVAADAEALVVEMASGGRRCAPLDTSMFQKTHQLEGLYAAAPIGICFIDTNHVHVSVNEKFAEMLGREPQEMVGKTVHEFLPADLADQVAEILGRVLQGETVRLEDFYVPHNGRVLLIMNKRVDDEQGVPLGMSISAVDITEKKNLEGALSELEDLAHASFELHPSVAWMANVAGEITYIGCALEGKREALADRLEDWRSRIHPDDAERVRQEWLDHVHERSEFRCRFRINRHGVGYRWMQSKAKPIAGTGQRAPGWVGVIADIHDQHLLETRISELERREAN